MLRTSLQIVVCVWSDLALHFIYSYVYKTIPIYVLVCIKFTWWFGCYKVQVATMPLIHSADLVKTFTFRLSKVKISIAIKYLPLFSFACWFYMLNAILTVNLANAFSIICSQNTYLLYKNSLTSVILKLRRHPLRSPDTVRVRGAFKSYIRHMPTCRK